MTAPLRPFLVLKSKSSPSCSTYGNAAARASFVGAVRRRAVHAKVDALLPARGVLGGKARLAGALARARAIITEVLALDGRRPSESHVGGYGNGNDEEETLETKRDSWQRVIVAMIPSKGKR